jgi:hypothetical protein
MKGEAVAAVAAGGRQKKRDDHEQQRGGQHTLNKSPPKIILPLLSFSHFHLHLFI